MHLGKSLVTNTSLMGSKREKKNGSTNTAVNRESFTK